MVRKLRILVFQKSTSHGNVASVMVGAISRGDESEHGRALGEELVSERIPYLGHVKPGRQWGK